MRDYGKVSPKFWTGKTGKTLRKHPEAQIVALYLMTCPLSEMTGVFQCPLMYIAHETGLGEEGALKGLARLIEVDFCTFEEDEDMVFVHEMAKFQIGEELKVNDNQVKSVRKAYSSMKGTIKSKFYERYKDAFHLTESSPSKAPSETLRSQEQEQEQEKEQEQAQATCAGAVTAVQISIAMRKAGVQSQPADPRLIALAEQGITPETVDAACAEAKRSKPNETIGVGYVVKILERWAKDAADLKAKGASAPQKQGAWWATDASVLAKGAELGLSPGLGEPMHAFKGRVQVAIGGGPAPPKKPTPTIDEQIPSLAGPKGKKPEGLDLKALLKKEAA